MALLLAQRMRLTEEEEAATIAAFFAGSPSEQAARFEGYSRVKRIYLQPIGGKPTFPNYFNTTCRHFIRDQKFREGSGDRQILVEAADTRQNGYESIEELGLENSDSTLLNSPTVAPYIPLKQLRRSEPNLHRAVLQRHARKRIVAICRPEFGGEVCVSRADVDATELERVRNAELKRPRRFAERRAEWMQQLRTQGLSKAAAQRKLKRWMNTEGLSTQEIEESLRKGRLVRLPPPSEPS
jgi:hypothetical protein